MSQFLDHIKNQSLVIYDPIQQHRLLDFTKYNIFVRKFESTPANKILDRDGLLSIARGCLVSKNGVKYQILSLGSNQFLSFIVGRVRYKFPSLQMSRCQNFISAFTEEIINLAKQLEIKPFLVPGMMQVPANGPGIKVSQLANWLEDSCTDRYRKVFFSNATTFFYKMTKRNFGLTFTPAYEYHCVNEALKIAVKQLITCNTREPEVPFSVIKNAINSELKTLVDKSIEKAVHTKKSLSRSVKILDAPTLVNFNAVQTWPLKNKVISMAGAHYHMLKMLNSHARVMLPSEQIKDLTSSAFTKTVEKIKCNVDPMNMVLLSIVESTIKSEVENLFQHMMQQSTSNNKELATVGVDQLIATTQEDVSLNFVAVSSSSCPSIRSDLKFQPLISENVKSFSVEIIDHLAQTVDNRNGAKEDSSRGGTVNNSNQNSRKTDQNLDIIPPVRGVNHQIGLGRCPEAGCSVFYPGDRGVINLHSHLFESHLYPRFIEKWCRNGQLVCCNGLNKELDPRSWISHYRQKHCKWKEVMRSLLLTQLGHRARTKGHWCPICHKQITVNFIVRKVAYSVIYMKGTKFGFHYSLNVSLISIHIADPGWHLFYPQDLYQRP